MARGVAKKGEVERKKGPFDILKNASQQCTSDGDGTRGKGKQKGESSSDQDCPLLDRLAVGKGRQNSQAQWRGVIRQISACDPDLSERDGKEGDRQAIKSDMIGRGRL